MTARPQSQSVCSLRRRACRILHLELRLYFEAQPMCMEVYKRRCNAAVREILYERRRRRGGLNVACGMVPKDDDALARCRSVRLLMRSGVREAMYSTPRHVPRAVFEHHHPPLSLRARPVQRPVRHRLRRKVHEEIYKTPHHEREPHLTAFNR